jgi:hypothetical protein
LVGGEHGCRDDVTVATVATALELASIDLFESSLDEDFKVDSIVFTLDEISRVGMMMGMMMIMMVLALHKGCYRRINC